MKIKRFEFNMFPVNCYVLWDDTKEAVVIDPGCFYEEEKQALKKFILTNELNVKHLLNTHLHLDHRKSGFHWENICTTEILSPSDTPSWKQSMFPDTHPAASCIIVKKTTACSPVTYCFKAVSVAPTCQEATSTN